MVKYIIPTFLTAISMTLLSGCVTQSFENNEPIVKNQANRDEMAATRISLGLGYLKMGDMSQAKLNLEKAKKFSPNLVQVHTAFAHYYETVGEGKLAIESFEQALSIKADSADTLNNYGVFLCRQDKLAEAEVQFLKAIAVPSYLLVSESYENLASCYLQSDDFEKAEMYLHKSIHHSPNRTSTLLQMVRLQYAMGNYQESKRFLQKFERNTQRFTANSLSLAYKLYWKLGRRRTAGNYANMLVKMYPQSWESKQYILNELELIDADNLANKYQFTQKEKNRQLSPSSHKRVVKLSPRKSANTPYTSSIKTVTPTIQTRSAATALLSTKVAEVVSAISKPTSDTIVTTVENVAQINKETDKITPVVTEVGVINEVVSSTIEPTSTQPIAATRDVLLPEALPEIVEIEAVEIEAVEIEVISVEEVSNEFERVDTPEALPEIVEIEAVETEAVETEAVETEAVETEAVATEAVATEAVATEAVEIEAVEIEVISVEEVSNEFERVDTQEVFHTVIPGENLYNISVEYNVKIEALRKWNNLSEKNKIRIGDKLYVVDPQIVNNIND